MLGFRRLEKPCGEWVSPYRLTVWGPGVMGAECSRCQDPCNPACQCGIHAYHDLGPVLEELNWRSVAVAVVGFGRVLIHDIMWRAEQVLPVAVLSERESDQWALDAASALQVPALTRRTLLAYASEFGETRRRRRSLDDRVLAPDPD